MIVTPLWDVHPATPGSATSASCRAPGARRDNATMVRVLVTAWVCSLLAACAPELDWRELRLDPPGVSQLFPCKPSRQQRSAVVGGQERPLVLHVCDAGGATWALSHFRVRTPLEVPAALDALAAAAHANLGAARTEPREQPVPGAGGYAAAGRYRISGHRPDGTALQSALLLYARGTVVVQLTVLGPRLADEAVAAFFAGARASIP